MWKKVAEYPVPLSLRRILKDKLSGELLFRADNVEKVLYFKEGRFIFARTNVIQERLGEILFKMGKIDRARFWNIHKLMEGKRERVGKVLVQSQVLNQQDIYQGLLFQLRTIAVSLFAFTSGEWSFVARAPRVPEDSNFIVELPEIIIEGVKKLKNLSYFRNKFYYQAPRVSPIPPAISVYFPQETIYFYRQVSSFKNFSNERIITELGDYEDVFWRNMALFYLLDIVDFTEATQDKEVNKNIEEILDLYEKLRTGKIDYFQLFGLPYDATAEAIKNVYFQFARKYHPDRVINAPDPDIKDKANFVFSEINKAYDLLSHEGKRRQYMEQEQRSVGQTDITCESQADRARTLYRKAKTLYTQKQYWEAVALLDEAVKLQNDKAAYFLLLGLCQMNVPSLKRIAEKNLLCAIEIEPWNEEILTALGVFYLSENQLKRAEGFFRKVLAANPDHVLARKKLAEIFPEDAEKKDRFSIFGKPKK